VSTTETVPSPPDLRGDVRRDDLSRQLYSTDASIYKVHPRYVCIPSGPGDLNRLVEWVDNHELSLVPRGAGTSLSGQSIGSGAVVDCSRHLTEILDVDPSERTARVQPGVVLDHLNQLLAEHGLQFGPDVATASRANLGGMIGNNSAGAHSIRYGHTAEHVRALEVLLPNGEEVTFEPITREEARARAGNGSLEARLYRDVLELVESHAELIRDAYPTIQRNSSGYGLDRFLDKLERDVVDFTELICGSEGTLGLVKEATLDLVSAPRSRGALVYHADDLLEAMELNRCMVEEASPYAVELIDDTILDLARDSLETSRMLDWVEGSPSTLLVVEQAEFEDSADLADQLERTRGTIRDSGFNGELVEATTEDQLEQVWSVRKAGLPLLLGLPGNDKPTTFVEDTAVDPARLADYVRDFQELVEDHGTRAAFYGHSSVGCLHIRPLVNLKSEEGVQAMRSLAEDAFDLVLEYNGVISGEHGVGRARSEWLETMYGSEVVSLFESIKHCFDPDNRFNPGNVVDPSPMTENLRFGADYEASSFDSVRDFSDKNGFTEFVELCNGNGACRKEDSGTMCPSYMVTREEKHSTRGRANALRGLLDGDLDPSALTDGTMEEVMELCISCKGCKSECPTGIDMAPMKEEVLHRIHREKGASLRDRFFAEIGTIFRVLAPASGMVNWIQSLPGVEGLTKKILGVGQNRHLPKLARDTFPFHEFPSTSEGLSNPVVLHVDTFTGYVEPDVARDATRVLEALGYDVVVPRLPDCGRPMMSKGFLDRAEKQVSRTLDHLGPMARRNLPIVGLEPSCVSAFTDDYQRFESSDRAEMVARQTRTFTEFLSEEGAESLRNDLGTFEEDVLIHGHCHQEALYGTGDAQSLFEDLTDGAVRVLDSGCCGMAGSFGFEAEHVEHSREMGERVLLPEVREAPSETLVLASGTSCRQQVADFTDRRALHPAEVLRGGLD
jgi:FAD/FMN-containing dehydrogenase/Fe-S oxidoreductase